MKTWVHVVFSTILAYLFYPVFGWKIIFIYVGGVLIDIDHYLWYIYKVKDLDIFKCYKYYIESHKIKNFDKDKGALMIFHTVEFLLLIVFLAFYFEIALAFFTGLIVHYILDIIFLIFVVKGFILKHSIIAWLINPDENDKKTRNY